MAFERTLFNLIAGLSILAGGCKDRAMTILDSPSATSAEVKPSVSAPETPLPSPPKPNSEPPSPPVQTMEAKRGADEQADLGMKYVKGDGVPVDLNEAIRLFTLSAEAGSPTGQYYLGAAYSHGKGVEKDDKAAFKWCLEAAKQGHVKAQVFVGEMYAKGDGVDQDDSEAFTWFDRAAKQNDVEAQAWIANAYLHGEGVPGDHVKAAEWLKLAAEKGDATSQANLANLLLYGIGIERDLEQGVMWARKSAEQNHVLGQYTLATLYEDGRGVPKDLSEAIKWYRKAAEKGMDKAQIELANLLIEHSDPKVQAEAQRWYKAAAEKENSSAQFQMGRIFELGKGVPVDHVAAAAWYEKAANQGDKFAQHNLARLYLKGLGVPKNGDKAFSLYTEAANQGITNAQVNLGVMYANGDGVPVNDVEAYKWFLIAGGKGVQEAQKYISIIEKRLTPDQRAEGQNLARNFQPKETETLQPWDQGPKVPNFSSLSQPKQFGSGFFITQNGYFVTNYHVIENATNIRLISKTGSFQAKVVSADPSNDLVLLKAEGAFTPLPVTSSRSVRLGSTVSTVGFPNISLQGHSPKFAKGEIASLAGIQDDARQFQISVPIQPGNSGGPLVDELGNVVGVIVAKLSQKTALAATGMLAENVNYAIKSSFLLSFLEATPEAVSGLIEAIKERREFEDIVTETEKASALVLVY